MSILNAFKSELKDNTAQQLIVTVGAPNPATGKNYPPTETWTDVGNCLFWRGAQAESVVASKIRDQVDAVAVFEPTKSITGEKLRITTVNTGLVDDYEIIGRPDNIGGAGEVIQVALKLVK